ncbi:signal peptidase I [Nonomuraea sp. NPDC059023]|uniref:signal peptidase I n=1 Tax=unclassified Nonomuraea TaxID=2593643 RepID=UPI00369BD971
MRALGKLIGAALMVAWATSGCGVVDRVLGSKSYTAASISMEPTIKDGERFSASLVGDDYVPKIGDIIVYREPPAWRENPEDGEVTAVSRIIGTPGTSVECCTSSGKIQVDGKPLDEPYAVGDTADFSFSASVGSGRLWIMCDNRDSCLDSRTHQNKGAPGGGTIALSDVVGVVDRIGER